MAIRWPFVQRACREHPISAPQVLSQVPLLCAVCIVERLALESSAPVVKCPGLRSRYLSCGTLWPVPLWPRISRLCRPRMTLRSTRRACGTGAVPRRTRSRSPVGQERHRHRFRPAEHSGARWPGRRMTGRHRVAEHATGGGQVDDRRQAQLALAGSATGQSDDGDLLRASAIPNCATSSGGGPDPQPLPGSAYRSPPRFHTAS